LLNIINFIKDSKTLSFTLKIMPILLFATVFLFKTIYFEIIFGNLSNTSGKITWLIFKHDTFIMGIILLFYYFSSITKGVVRVFSRVLPLVLIILYTIDMVLFLKFTTRIFLEDIIRYSYDIIIFMGSLERFFTFGTILFMIIVFPLGVIFLFYTFTYDSNIKKRRYLLIAIVLILFNSILHDSLKSYNWIYQNIVELNYRQGLNISYSKKIKKYYKNMDYSKINNITCKDKEYSKKKNIILLVVESYSMYHSKYFSGLRDYTPHIDKIAKENISFTNFYANSFKTEGGLIALLMGINPFPVVKQYYIKGKGFRSTLHFKENSLPNRLKALGYETEFLTTGNLEFADKDYWLDEIGFDYKEGAEHPYYNNWKRFKFNAAEDKALFNRVKARMKLQKKPYFIAIENVSTHYPFINPKTGKMSEEGAFRYFDNEFKIFYKYLVDNNFFDNGILIVVPDHRATTLINEGEDDLYKDRAPSIIPTFVIDGKTKEVITDRYQQTDIPNSIINLLSNKVCTSDFSGDIFKKITPKYIYHTRYDNKSIVNLFTQSRDYRIKLNGDKTSFNLDYSTNTDFPKDEKRIIDKINYERIIRK